MHSTNGSNEEPQPPTYDEIATCAYLIWVKEGRPPGREAEHWHQAETQLHAMRLHDGWVGETDDTAHHTVGE